MQIDIITIFPEYFSPVGVSLIGKAVQRGDIVVKVHDLRSWTHDIHRTVDDSPFGGGPGMVMKPEPWGAALDDIVGSETDRPTDAAKAAPAKAAPAKAAPAEVAPTEAASTGTAATEFASTGTAATKFASTGAAETKFASTGAAETEFASTGAAETEPGAQLIVPTPAGALFNQATAAELATVEHLVFACGRYEGIDDRVAQYARRRMTVRELSIGDYVLAGGEPAVLVMIEAICRLVPGVIGNAESAPDDSFGAGDGPMSGLVEGPTYTRPRTWRDLKVPDVLLSGDHAAISRWRRDQALGRTARNRPDLVAKLPVSELDGHDKQVLSEAGFAVNGNNVAD